MGLIRNIYGIPISRWMDVCLFTAVVSAVLILVVSRTTADDDNDSFEPLHTAPCILHQRTQADDKYKHL